ncbi:MAG TPA: general secretion pathway protein GspB [Steroidobacteraceae bacterium]|nr:general secretion pathway protein GspB [Steroidobacteraceae bacterium]
MSFILDALKKSESDRQRQSGPSLFEVKVAPPRRTLPVWAMAIAVLLAVNVVVISWMLLRHAAAERPAAATAPASPPAAQTAAEPAATRSPPAAARSGQAPAPSLASGAFSSPPPPPAAATAAGAAQASAPSPSAVPGPPAAATPAPADSPAAPDPSDYAPAVPPTATQGSGATPGALPLYPQVVATDGLPTLHLDLHVYAKNPKDRFVMINMHKLVEGDSLPDGVHVDAIRPDGVVLSYHGTRFLLPRD